MDITLTDYALILDLENERIAEYTSIISDAQDLELQIIAWIGS